MRGGGGKGMDWDGWMEGKDRQVVGLGGEDGWVVGLYVFGLVSCL